MKKIVSVILALSLIFTLAACGGTGSDTSAELEDTLVIYSTHGEDLLEMVASAFEEETGVNVEYINLKGELADRVRSEAENPQADIMYGGDSATYTIMKGEGLYAATSPSWAEELDPAFKDADGCWYGTIKTPVMLFYNSDIMTEEEAPKDWADLVKPEFKDKIVVRDSLSSSMRSTICNLIDNISASQDEQAAWDYLAALDGNIKNYYNSGSMMYSAVGKGEAAVSWAVLSDITTNVNDNQMPFSIIDAESGAVVLTDCIAALNNAPHPNAAAAFVEFAGSAEVQAMLANEFSRVPTLDSALGDCPEWMQTEYKAMDVDWSNISANQNEWLEQWETDVINTSKNVAKE